MNQETLSISDELTLERATSSVSPSLNRSEQINYIGNSSRHDEIFDVLDAVGTHEVSDRLKYLHEITQDQNPLEPSMELRSLKNLASFFLMYPDKLVEPEITIDPNGLLHAQWYFGRAAALMIFLEDGHIEFAATEPISHQNTSRDIQGVGDKGHALSSIENFILNLSHENLC